MSGIPNMLGIESLGSLCISRVGLNQIYLGMEIMEDTESND